MCLNTPSTLLAVAPAYNIAAVSRIFPAGILQQYGWLCHTEVAMQLLQMRVIISNVPTSVTWLRVSWQPHQGQWHHVSNAIRDEINTIICVPCGGELCKTALLQEAAVLLPRPPPH